MSTQNGSELHQLMEQIRRELEPVNEADRGKSTRVAGRPDVGEIMRRVRAEVARRRGHASTEDAGTGDGSIFPRWHAVAGDFAPQGQYALGDLLKYADEDFVFAAYRAVLRRTPDENGLRHYLGRLRDGHTSKVEVLGDLRWSAEGRARGVHIDGLLIPYKFSQWKRKRVVGPIIRWVHAFVRLGGLFDRQGAQMARQIHDVHALGRTLNELSLAIERWQGVVQQQVDERPTLNAVQVVAHRLDENIELTARHSQLISEFAQVQMRVDELESRSGGYANDLELRSLSAAIDGFRSHLDQLSREQAAGKASVVKLDKEALHAERRIEHMERAWAAQVGRSTVEFNGHLKGNHLAPSGALSGAQYTSGAEARRAEEGPTLDLDPFYAAFEDRFRGDRDLVRRRAEPYLSWIKDVGAGTTVAPVLDIGCGRGEWLELLREHGLVAKGIDLNRVFADICRGYGLDIIEGDAISAMSVMPAASIGAITSMHLVEHLSFEQMIALFDEANRVLVPGGLIVIETPNPENILVGSHTFYMDPTHRNPIPPEALRWIVEARGFYSARIERLTIARELNAPPLLPDDLPGASSINVLLASLQAAPDYAIVARKS